MYINTSNTELDLSQGAVSQALATAAGPILQAECSKKKTLQVGGIATTTGGQLQCQYVIHTVLPQYDGTGGRAMQVKFDEMLHSWETVSDAVNLRSVAIILFQYG